MGKTWISVGCAIVASVASVALGACAAAPKPPPEPPAEEKEPEPADKEASAPAEETQEEVCDKMWSLIEVDAEDAAKKAKKKGKKAKLPTEEDQKEFLADCVERGTKQKKEEPERYECMRTCIMESISTAEVETCAKDCP